MYYYVMFLLEVVGFTKSLLNKHKKSDDVDDDDDHRFKSYLFPFMAI